MKRTALLVAVFVLASVAPARAQTPAVRTIVVTEFENTSLDSSPFHAAQLSPLLGQLLQQQGTQFRVVAGPAVRDALRARGYAPADLVSPSKAAEIAQAFGADWVVTGRWSQLRVITVTTPTDDPSSPRDYDAFAIASATVRVLDAASRQRLFEGRFDGQAHGHHYGSLYLAAYQALLGAASAISKL